MAAGIVRLEKQSEMREVGTEKRTENVFEARCSGLCFLLNWDLIL